MNKYIYLLTILFSVLFKSVQASSLILDDEQPKARSHHVNKLNLKFKFKFNFKFKKISPLRHDFSEKEEKVPILGKESDYNDVIIDTNQHDFKNKFIISTDLLTTKKGIKTLRNIVKENQDSLFELLIKKSSFLKDDTLEFGGILSHIRHLKLVDLSDCVSSLGDDFISPSEKLTTIKMVGFSELKSIGGAFLSNSPNLESFETTGFPKLEVIGEKFLAYCPHLRYVSVSAFSKATKVGHLFMYRSKPKNLFPNQ